MQLRYKVELLQVVPLILASGLLALVVDRKGKALEDSQIAEVEPVLLKAKEDQLVKVVELALHAVPELNDQQRDGKRALEKLRGLRFGEADDGYFYVYDMNTSVCLMNAQSPHLEGKNQADLRDDRGQMIMPRLFAQARTSRGRGFTEYRWQRPSQANRWSPKLGYVVQLPGNWMLGTGVYIDDLQATLAQLRAASSATIDNTMIFIAVLAVLAVLVVAVAGRMLNVSQQRLANSKLQRLTRQVVTAQDAERARMSRYLHDEAVQEVIAAKCVLETALITLRSHLPSEELTAALEQRVTGLAETVERIRTISHEVRTPLHSADLPALLTQTASAFAQRTRVAVAVDASTDGSGLSTEAATALFRIAQQALDNVERHACASRVEIRLFPERDGPATTTCLTVTDDGFGFDVAAVEAGSRSGIGLLNMRERVDALGGRISIRSSPAGTQINACLPDGVPAEDYDHDNT